MSTPPADSAPAVTPAGERGPGFAQGLVTGALISALLAGAALLWLRWPQPAALVVQPPPTPPPVVAPTAAPITVYVSGAVAQPGLYTLTGDGRVANALEAAGGLLAAADGRALNLAQPLADGARLHVPAVGEAPAVELVTGAGATRGIAVDVPGAPVNLNRATLEELLALPGVGEKMAAAIVAARPFASVDALDAVPGVGPATLEELRPLVTAP